MSSKGGYLTFKRSSDTKTSSDSIDAKEKARTSTINESQDTEKKENNETINDYYYLLINDDSFLNDQSQEYPDNVITSSKYTILTFIPLNLFEQVIYAYMCIYAYVYFRRIANIYFLMIIAIQTVPGITPFSVWTSVMPLLFILSVSAAKDGYEDYQRHQDDKRANSLP
ncbi:transmembrane protein, partial [Reticulomyxa filosa]